MAGIRTQKYGIRIPPFHAIWTVYIGVGGGLQFVDKGTVGAKIFKRPSIRVYLDVRSGCPTSGLLTGGFPDKMTRDVGTSMSARHPNVATYPLAKHCILWGIGKERVVTSGWLALTDVPTSLVIQLRKPPVSKPPVRHSLFRVWDDPMSFGTTIDCQVSLERFETSKLL